jgi:hypothetical protein
MGLSGWLRLDQLAELDEDASGPRRERRRTGRNECVGRKMIIRQRRSLGIIHLRNLSRLGACGLTDMPLAVDSIVFLELRRKHFFAAYVKWTRNLTVGLELIRPISEEALDKLVKGARDAAPSEARLREVASASAVSARA